MPLLTNTKSNLRRISGVFVSRWSVYLIKSRPYSRESGLFFIVYQEKKSINWKMMACTPLESQFLVWLWNVLYPLHTDKSLIFISSFTYITIMSPRVFQIWAWLPNLLIENPIWISRKCAWCIKKFSWKFPCSWTKVEQATRPGTQKHQN